MKRVLLFLVLAHMPVNCLNVKEYVCSMFYKKTVACTPRVRVISISDNLDFKQVTDELVAAAKDTTIDGIILKIDNGGGHTGSFSVLHDIIKKVTTIKPVISLIGGYAGSCGYMIASAANYIVAHTLSDIGSIGVLWEITRLKNPKTTKDIEAEMQVEIFYCGQFKTVGFPHAKDFSDKDRAYVQHYLDEIYKQFLNSVAKNRNLDNNTSKEWAEGKMFIAPQALQLGLIDEIGTIFEVETKILQLIKQKNPTISYADSIELI
ncbi:MAG: S49 family peptidase [Candidatus Babeliales bacterium]|nr:S49 family peptidase [Candidatus Babeliales bacterium]